MMTVSFSISLVANAPYPPLGDLRTSKKSVTKSGSASEDLDVEEEEEDDGVSIGGGEGVVAFRERRGAKDGEEGGVKSNWRWKDCLEARTRAGDLAAPLTAP